MAMRDEAVSKVEIDVEQNLLNFKVELSDGTSGNVFTRNPLRNEAKTLVYNCHLCGVPNLPGERCLYTHINGRRHQTKLTQKPFDAHLFRTPLQKFNKIVMQIAPGEPVPPGFENEVKPVAEIQQSLDRVKNVSLIGLEYLIELKMQDGKEPGHICVLCEKRGDARTIFDHLTSYKHRIKYLEKHFPTVTREIAVYRYNRDARDALPHIIQKVSDCIEDYHGRLAPNVFENQEFERNRSKCFQEVHADKHFSEKSGKTFVDVLDDKEFKELIAKCKVNAPPETMDGSPRNAGNSKHRRGSNDRRRSLDSISSISSSSFGHPGDDDDDDDVILVSETRIVRDRRTHGRNSRSKSRDFATRKRSRSPLSRERTSRAPLPSPRELAMQANAIHAEKYKWEKYKCQLEIALKDLTRIQKEHEKSPESHPLYPEEWKTFWNRRYKELQAEKKDPSKHDFKPEWVEFWTKRMGELHKEAIEKKKEELRKNLNLPKDGVDCTSELKERFNIKAPPPSRKELESSSDEERRGKSSRRDRPGRSRTRTRSRSRSRERMMRHSDRRKRSYDHERDEYERVERDRRERERERDRDRGRHHRADSREDYYDDSPARYSREERESSDYYGPGNPYKWHAGQSKPQLYPPKVPPYYGREVPASSMQYEEKEEEPENDDNLTCVVVLRLLSALEELLGPSLGPKIVELLAKALALEKVKANSADELLLNEENCVLFETIKEKLKGQLMADMVEKHRLKAVKRAIKNIAGVIHIVSERDKNKSSEEKQTDSALSKQSTATAVKDTVKPTSTEEEEKQEMAKKIAAALVKQGKTNISTEELETLVNYYYEKQRKAKESAIQAKSEPNTASTSDTPTVVTETVEKKKEEKDETIEVREDNEEFGLPSDTSSALESLTDVDLQTLLQSFQDLSEEEQQHLHTYMKKLEACDPIRVEKLRKYVTVAFDTQDDVQETIDVSSEPMEPLKTMQGSHKPSASSNPYDDIFYDDTKDINNKQNNIIDSDDDDYSYDDLCKAASKNVKEKPVQRRSPVVNSPNEFFLGDDKSVHNDDLSNSSTRNNGENLNSTKIDTDLIANIMGSLQKNVQSRNFSDRSNNDFSNNELNSQKSAQRIQRNVPFYQQQQSYPSSYGKNDQPKQTNQFYGNDFNAGRSNQFPPPNQIRNMFASFNQSFDGAAQMGIPLNIPQFAQQQGLTMNQQTAMMSQMNQQSNRPPQMGNHYRPKW